MSWKWRVFGVAFWGTVAILLVLYPMYTCASIYLVGFVMSMLVGNEES